MFTPDDFWRIFRVLKDSTDVDPKLDPNTKILAESEQQTSKQFFLNTLDQTAHLTDDYKRLRDFFVDWYASHKTITSTQKSITDVYSLPSDHVSELIRSFGFTYGLNLVPLTNKVNMFLDLVNLYKKKGTPEAMADILDYYGFSDADIIEYWLVKDQFGNLVFRGHNVRRSSSGSTALIDEDVAYNTMTEFDPHWLLTEAQIHSLFASNKINLPSKSPFFSLSSVFAMRKLSSAVAIMSRIVQDEYQRYFVNGLPLSQNLQIRGLGWSASLLEVYLAAIYCFEKLFGTMSGSSDLNYLCYNGTVEYSLDDPPTPINLDTLVTEYESLVADPPVDRAERDTRLAQLESDWTRDLSTNIFDSSAYVSATLLNTINPALKAECDSWFVQNQEDFLISYLIGTLDNWTRTQIDTQTPSLVVTVLGFGFREEVGKIIEFFKPYRARLAFLDTAYAIRNPLTESIRIEDGGIEETHIEQTHIDILNIYDDFFTDIYMSFIDTVTSMDCAAYAHVGYDQGGYYDDALMFCDLFEVSVGEVFDGLDNVDVSDNVVIGFPMEFNDLLRSYKQPPQMDSGYNYDQPIQGSMIDDRDHVVIVSIP